MHLNVFSTITQPLFACHMRIYPAFPFCRRLLLCMAVVLVLIYCPSAVPLPTRPLQANSYPHRRPASPWLALSAHCRRYRPLRLASTIRAKQAWGMGGCHPVRLLPSLATSSPHCLDIGRSAALSEKSILRILTHASLLPRIPCGSSHSVPILFPTILVVVWPNVGGRSPYRPYPFLPSY